MNNKEERVPTLSETDHIAPAQTKTELDYDHGLSDSPTSTLDAQLSDPKFDQVDRDRASDSSVSPPPVTSKHTGLSAKSLPFWSYWTPFAVILGASLFAGVAVLGVVKLGEWFHLDGWTVIQVTEIVSEDMVFIGILAFTLIYGAFGFGNIGLAQRIGLNRVKPLRAIGWTVAVAIVVFGVDFLFSLVAPGEHQDPVIVGVNAIGINTAFAAIILAPIIEEIFFRGVLFPLLSRRLGIIAGALLSGLIFGFAHFGNSDLLLIGVLSFGGFLLALLYVRTGSIIPGIILHGVNNAIVVLVQFGLPDVPAVGLGLLAIPLLLLLVFPFARRRQNLIGSPGHAY